MRLALECSLIALSYLIYYKKFKIAERQDQQEQKFGYWNHLLYISIVFNFLIWYGRPNQWIGLITLGVQGVSGGIYCIYKYYSKKKVDNNEVEQKGKINYKGQGLENFCYFAIGGTVIGEFVYLIGNELGGQVFKNGVHELLCFLMLPVLMISIVQVRSLAHSKTYEQTHGEHIQMFRKRLEKKYRKL